MNEWREGWRDDWMDERWMDGCMEEGGKEIRKEGNA